MGAIARDLPTLRFIALVRNPVDIAISSIRKGYSLGLVREEEKDDFDAVFTQIVRRLGWFSRHAVEQPEQFRMIFQDELLDRTQLSSLCAFLRLSAPESWLDSVARLVRLRASYPIAEDHKARLRAATLRLIPHGEIGQRVAAQIV